MLPYSELFELEDELDDELDKELFKEDLELLDDEAELALDRAELAALDAELDVPNEGVPEYGSMRRPPPRGSIVFGVVGEGVGVPD